MWRRVRWRAACMAGMFAAAIAGAGSPAAAWVQYGCFRFLPSPGPDLYLELRDGKLRVGRTLGELEKTKSLKPAAASQHDQEYSQFYVSYDFPKMLTLVRAPGVDEIRAVFSFDVTEAALSPRGSTMRTGSWFYGRFWITRKDARGVPWTYVLRVGGESWPDPLVAGRKGSMVSVPGLDDLQMHLAVAPVTKDEARIGVAIGAGPETYVQNVLKAGKPAIVKIEVVGEGGKVVHRQSGDLQKLGFTRGGPVYSTRLPKPGLYTLKATFPIGAQREPLRAERQFRAPSRHPRRWGGHT